MRRSNRKQRSNLASDSGTIGHRRLEFNSFVANLQEVFDGHSPRKFVLKKLPKLVEPQNFGPDLQNFPELQYLPRRDIFKSRGKEL